MARAKYHNWLPIQAVMVLVQSAFYMGYFLLATPAALLMRKFGYKLADRVE